MSSWVSLLATEASLGQGGLQIGGHAMLAMNLETAHEIRYEVFHFDGGFDTVSGKPWKDVREKIGRTAYKAYTSVRRFGMMPSTVERLRSEYDSPLATSCGGNSGIPIGYGRPLAGGSAWHRFEENYNEWGVTEGARFEVGAGRVEHLINECMKTCAFNSGPPFCLVGADIRHGVNCITWAYDMLRNSGISFSPRTYIESFVSPAQAVAHGGRLKRRWVPSLLRSCVSGGDYED